MREDGIDLSSVVPSKLTDDLASEADILVTMGCGETCPVVPEVERDDWPLEDPKGKPIERVRQIRDDVEARVRTMLASRGWLRAGGK
jgi:arsenate reductase